VVRSKLSIVAEKRKKNLVFRRAHPMIEHQLSSIKVKTDVASHQAAISTKKMRFFVTSHHALFFEGELRKVTAAGLD
jgi:hypothetical protein